MQEKNSLKKKAYPRIFVKYLIILSLISILPLFIAGIISTSALSFILKEKSMSMIEAILEERMDSIRRYAEAQRKSFTGIASHPRIIEYFERYYAGASIKALEKEFGDEIAHFCEGHGFYDILLVTKEGIASASYMKESYYGKNILADSGLKDTAVAKAVLDALKDRKTTVTEFEFYPPSNKYAMFGVAPVIKKGSVAGAAVFQYMNSAVNSLVENSGKLGPGAETVFGIKKGDEIIFISGLKGANRQAFELKLRRGVSAGTPMQLAVDGKAGSGISVDYRGKKVMAAWDYSAGLGCGVVVKKDIEEVMKPINRMMMAFILSGLLMLVLVAAIAYAAARAVSDPIEEIVTAARLMAGGDLSARVRVKENDETAEIARAMNSLASGLEKQVEKLSELNMKLVEEARRANYYLDVSEALVLELDAKGRVISVNRKSSDLLGCKPSAAAGKDWFETFIPVEDRGKIREIFRQIVAGKSEFSEYHENRIAGLDGKVRHIFWHNALIRDEKGSVQKVISSGIDITQLRDTEENLKAILANTSMGVAIVQDNRIRYVNKAWEKMLEYGAEEILSWKEGEFAKLAHPEHREFMIEQAAKKQAAEAGVVINYQTRMITKSGRVKWFDLHSGTMKFSSRNADLVTVMDITELKEMQEALERSEEQFRVVFELSTAGKSLTAPDGRLLKVNRAFASMLGYEEHEMEKIDFSRITYGEDVAASRAVINELVEGKKQAARFEKRYVHRNGGIIWADVGTILLRDRKGNPVYFITTVLDINERKKLEEELKRSNAELEQFAFIASHDLQEPIRAISGFLKLLEQKLGSSLDEEGKKYINFAVSGSVRMKELINALLAFSRVQKKPAELQKVDMNAAFSAAVFGLGTAISESGARVESERLPAVMADETQMTQVFQNLISNAIKYRREKPPQVKVSAVEKEKEHVFCVSDNGIGIDPAYFDKIFVIFQRLHAREEYPGTGIGLAICRKIIENHGGRIWIESEPGKGSRFYFTVKKQEA